jgi:hypothetical protein
MHENILAIAARLSDDALLARLKSLAILAESGELHEAVDLVKRVRHLFEARAPKIDRLRFDWVAARLESELGNYESAAMALVSLRRGFLGENLPYDVALVSLDLALTYARLGRRRELRQIAAETSFLFASLGIDREHIGSLNLLSQTNEAQVAEVAAALAVSGAQPLLVIGAIAGG